MTRFTTVDRLVWLRYWRMWIGALLLCLGWLGSGCAWAAPLGSSDLLWLDRLSFGISPDSVADLQRLGRKAWLAEQLRPGPDKLPPEVQASINALDISSRPTTQVLDELLAQRVLMREPDTAPASQPQMRRALRERARDLSDDAVQRSLLRAVHSSRQLQEVMTWFWFNHFNIVSKGNPELIALVGDYEDRAIRPHALGKFADLLTAVATHPTMLIYLNNDRNIAGRINENYARELMELHTLGVDGGYTQEDVQQLAHVLTGLGLRPLRVGPQGLPAKATALSDGMAVFFPNRHEDGTKTLLGRQLNGQGWQQIQQALDLLAHHPSTARYISRKLVQYFVADEPPPELVKRLTQRFLDTDGDIAAVLTLLAESPELEASLDRKFKDPLHFVVSAVRLTLPPGQTLENPKRLQHWLQLLGEPLFGRRTPDGYPLVASAWNGSGQMTLRFEVAQQLASGEFMKPHWDDRRRRGLEPQSPFSRDYLAPLLTARTREVLPQAAQPQEWRTLLLASPEFMTR